MFNSNFSNDPDYVTLENFVYDFVCNSNFIFNSQCDLYVRDYLKTHKMDNDVPNTTYMYPIVAIYLVLQMAAGKTSSILMEGASSAGKSMFAKVLIGSKKHGFFVQ